MSIVKLCRAKIHFKVHFFGTIAYFWLAINFVCCLCTRMSFFSKKSYFHDSVPLSQAGQSQRDINSLLFNSFQQDILTNKARSILSPCVNIKFFRSITERLYLIMHQTISDCQVMEYRTNGYWTNG